MSLKSQTARSKKFIYPVVPEQTLRDLVQELRLMFIRTKVQFSCAVPTATTHEMVHDS